MAHSPLSSTASRAPAAGRAAQLDWAQLLLPISDVAPSGPNLEYSAEFAELELLAHGTPDRQMGSALVPGQPADPAAVLQRAPLLLARTKDVRVLARLLAASLSELGVAAFVAGLAALRELLERFWATLHPELDPDDEALATARANAVSACASPELVLALRRAALIQAPSGARVSVEAALSALRDAGAESTDNGRAWLLSALRETPAAELEALASTLRSGLAHASAICALFAERSGAVPELEPLETFFRDALTVLRQHRTPEAPLEPEPHAATPEATAGSTTLLPGGAARGGAHNSIRSRDDVLAALEAICAYYRAHEPVSPLPLLLRRCQRLVGLDFLATLRELAPEAADQVALLGGTSSAPASGS